MGVARSELWAPRFTLFCSLPPTPPPPPNTEPEIKARD